MKTKNMRNAEFEQKMRAWEQQYGIKKCSVVLMRLENEQNHSMIENVQNKEQLMNVEPAPIEMDVEAAPIEVNIEPARTPPPKPTLQDLLQEMVQKFG